MSGNKAKIAGKFLKAGLLSCLAFLLRGVLISFYAQLLLPLITVIFPWILHPPVEFCSSSQLKDFSLFGRAFESVRGFTFTNDSRGILFRLWVKTKGGKIFTSEPSHFALEHFFFYMLLVTIVLLWIKNFSLRKVWMILLPAWLILYGFHFLSVYVAVESFYVKTLSYPLSPAMTWFLHYTRAFTGNFGNIALASLFVIFALGRKYFFASESTS